MVEKFHVHSAWNKLNQFFTSLNKKSFSPQWGPRGEALRVNGDQLENKELTALTLQSLRPLEDKFWFLLTTQNLFNNFLN